MNPLHWDWGWHGGHTPVRGLGSVVVLAVGAVFLGIVLWRDRRIRKKVNRG